MTEVLFVATVTAPLVALDDVAGELRSYGARVRLATYFDPETIANSLHLDEIHQVKFHLSEVGGRKVRRFSPQWFWVVLRNPLRRATVRRADRISRTWIMGRSDPWMRARAAEADLLVALDVKAVYCVWKLARRHPETRAIRGLYEALLAMRAGPVPDMAELAGAGVAAADGADADGPGTGNGG
jgi:hypothetical protein